MNLFLCYEKCSTCKKAEKWLTEHGIPFEKRSIKEEKPTEEELRQWVNRSGLSLKRFFNTSGVLYKELRMKDRLLTMTEDELYALLASDGMLVKRPIFVSDEFVFPGFREDAWKELLRK